MKIIKPSTEILPSFYDTKTSNPATSVLLDFIFKQIECPFL